MEETLDIEPEYAIKLVKEYLAGNWMKSTPETVSLKVISGGFCSRLYLCQDLTGSCTPSNVLIRLLGGKILDDEDFLKQYNQGTESIVFFMHGHLGFGPKLYGVFNEGRLEEYIPSRTLTNQDLEEPSIRKQFARKLARFHSMKLPVSQNQHPSFKVLSSIYELSKNSEYLQEFSDRSTSLGIDSSWTSKLDIAAEIEWARETLKLVGGRLVLSINDMNPRNCLIRETPDQFGEVVTLIDYEIGGTNWRGFDIGSHFTMRVFDFEKPDFRSNSGMPSEEIRREFIQEYLSFTEANGSYDSFDKDGLDSCDHVLMEADFMVFIWIILWVSFALKPKNNNFKRDDVAIVRGNGFGQVLVDLYPEHKRYFLAKYKHLFNSKLSSDGED